MNITKAQQQTSRRPLRCEVFGRIAPQTAGLPAAMQSFGSVVVFVPSKLRLPYRSNVNACPQDAAREKLQTGRKLIYARDQVEKLYRVNIAESQTPHLHYDTYIMADTDRWLFLPKAPKDLARLASDF